MCYFDLCMIRASYRTHFFKQNDKLVSYYKFLFCRIKLESNYRKVIYTALISFGHISANKNCQLLANQMKLKEMSTIFSAIVFSHFLQIYLDMNILQMKYSKSK